MKAGRSRRIARKYLQAGQPPNELQAKHTWRTRKDPLVEIWPQALQEKHLRTFQRRVKLWRLAHGPDKEVFFPQDWEAGRAMQLDWTNANELAVTIAGQPYEHRRLIARHDGIRSRLRWARTADHVEL